MSSNSVPTDRKNVNTLDEDELKDLKILRFTYAK